MSNPDADLKLDYLVEAKSSLDAYIERSSDEIDGIPPLREEQWLKQITVMALVSIADSLHRIVEEES